MSCLNTSIIPSHSIYGRSPEELFYDNHALANNRMPFCLRILKAERLQKFYKDGHTIIFGIGVDEPHCVKRARGCLSNDSRKIRATAEPPLSAHSRKRDQATVAE